MPVDDHTTSTEPFELNTEAKKPYHQSYYEANKERLKVYRESRKAKRQEYARAYYLANKEKIKTRVKTYKEADPDRKREADRAYYEANKEKHNARGQAYYEANRERFQQYDRDRRESVMAYRYASNYGLTTEALAELGRSQDFRCAICRTPFGIEKRKSATVHVDHDHSTGKVRGLLCNHCNVGLGMFKDDPRFLRRALKYLKDHISNG